MLYIIIAVFKPAIDLICDPDYINDKWHGWLDFKEQLQVEHKRTYHYAATYEDFVEIIRNCSDIEQLKHMRLVCVYILLVKAYRTIEEMECT